MSIEKTFAEKCRDIMNEFNFGELYIKNHNGSYHNRYGILEKAEVIKDDNLIIKTYKEGLDNLATNKTFGIISNGNHGLDLLEIYNQQHIGESDKQIDYKEYEEIPIMIVYDSPSNNLDDTFYCAGEKNTEKIKELLLRKKKNGQNISVGDYLCKHLWRSQDFGNCDCINKKYFSFNHYGQMILSFMFEGKQKNIYTTNLFRFEVTDVDKENFTNLSKLERKIVDDVFSKIFLKEIELFKPQIIVAVGRKVEKYLCKRKNKKAINEKAGKNVEVKYIIHPSPINRRNKTEQDMINNREEIINYINDIK